MTDHEKSIKGVDASSTGESDSTSNVIDLTNEPAIEGFLDLQTRRFDPRAKRENMRGWLTLGLLSLLALNIAVPVIGAVCFQYPVESAVKLVHEVVPVLVGLVGAATGFYYGSRDR